MEPTPSDVPTADRCDFQAESAADLAQLVFAGMARRRRWLASLPVEEKYRRFLQLQRIASHIKQAAGRPAPAPWPEEET